MQDPTSMLSLYRRLLALRRETEVLRSGAYRSLSSPPGVLRFERASEDDAVCVALNFTAQTRQLTEGGTVLVSTHLDRKGSESDGITLRANEGSSYAAESRGPAQES